MASHLIQEHFSNHVKTIETVSRQLSPIIERCAGAIIEGYRHGKKVLVMGNGGSAADAQHLAAELVGRFLMERKALPAIALTTDTSILTAVGNDYGYDAVFSRQVEAVAHPGDVVIGISTSGNSRNVYLALDVAKKIGCVTIGLLGKDGGAIAEMVDLNLTVQSNETPRIQEAHVTIIHILCDLVEKGLFSSCNCNDLPEK